MIYLDAKKNLCSLKLNVSYDEVVAETNALFSIDDIDDAMNAAIQKAWDYKLWPFTEGTFQTTANIPGGSGNPYGAITEIGDEFVEQSFFLAIINNVPWDGQGNGKRNIRDLIKWLADYSSDTSKIWGEYGGTIYVNLNALPADTDFPVVLMGKLHAPTYTTSPSDSSSLPFSLESDDTDSSGNEAIILLAYAYLLSSEKKKNPTQAALEEKKAYGILDTLWGFIAEGKAQNVAQNRPFFNTQDMFANRHGPYDNNIGNFNLP